MPRLRKLFHLQKSSRLPNIPEELTMIQHPPIIHKDIISSKVNAPKEEANAKDWNFNPAMPPGMTVHIELSRTVTDGGYKYG